MNICVALTNVVRSPKGIFYNRGDLVIILNYISLCYVLELIYKLGAYNIHTTHTIQKERERVGVRGERDKIKREEERGEREGGRKKEKRRERKKRKPEIPIQPILIPIHTHFHFPRAHVLQTFLISKLDEVNNYVFNTSIKMLC